MKKITKAQEIEMLETLRDSNSYLRDAFGEENLNAMIQNIINDFPINNGIFRFNKELDDTEAQLRDAIKTIQAEFEKSKIQESKFRENVSSEMLSSIYNDKTGYLKDFLERNYPLHEIVLRKIQLQIPVSDEAEQLVVLKAFENLK